jgi:uncharacterized protein
MRILLIVACLILNTKLCFGEIKNAHVLEDMKRRAKQGEAAAQFYLGSMYFKGEQVDKSPSKAIRLWHRAAEQGHEFAGCNLAVLYEKGTHVKQDPEKAIRLYQKHAKKDPRCFYNYAMALKDTDGQGARVISLLKDSSEKGYPSAVKALEKIYRVGWFGEPNILKANFYLRRLAILGDDDAMVKMSFILCEAETPDYEMGYAFAKLALQNANDVALELVNTISTFPDFKHAEGDRLHMGLVDEMEILQKSLQS